MNRRHLTPEERDAIVAAYAADGNADRVAAAFHLGRRAVIAALDAAGVVRPYQTAHDRAALRALWTEPWQRGDSFRSMRAMAGVGLADKTIAQIMAGITRRGRAWRPGYRYREAAALTDDPDAWRWFAGVFDAKGTVVRDGDGTDVTVSTGADRLLAETIATTIGAGRIHAKKAKTVYWRWEIAAHEDVIAVLERIEPYLRHRRTLVRRHIAALKGEEPDVERAPP